MSKKDRKRLCPVEEAGKLDSFFRKFIQNPEKILKPFIKKGMTVLDYGCGPGFFTVKIAEMLEGQGKVIAADLQEGMLEIIRKKIKGKNFENLIELHKCGENGIGIFGNADFIFAFYVMHEVKQKEKLFQEFKTILKPGGQIFIVEPKSHVKKNEFEDMITLSVNTGFEPVSRPNVFFSRTVLLGHK